MEKGGVGVEGRKTKDESMHWSSPFVNGSYLCRPMSKLLNCYVLFRLGAL